MELKRIFFLVDMKEEQKTGLFNATYNRIKYLIKHVEKYDVYSLREYDGKLLSLLKKVLNKNIKEKSKPNYEYRGIRIKYFYIKNTILSTLLKKMGIYSPIFIVMKLKKIAREYQMICAHWGHPQGSIARRISKREKIPYVITYHGSDIHSIPDKNKIFLKSIQKNLRDSSLNIFVSESLKRKSIEKIGNSNENNIVIPNGIDFNIYYELKQLEISQIKERLGFTKKIVGFVGNLYEVKRADRLPEIFRGIQLEYPNEVDFIVIGNGEFREHIEQKCKQYQLNVKFLGKIEPQEVNAYINIMDVLILPSRREAFGLVILEANASGTLAIGSDAGGISEVIDNDNLIVRDNNNFEQDMAQRVAYYLKNGYVKEELVRNIKVKYNLSILAKNEYDNLSIILNKSKGNYK
ncbi:glycosyltransferase [Bacillus paramycoides]|uniref:glycosyltransferase n=1 Tax=Bacillus paramycoides TaxID=2026194 RepID=UPI002E1AF124|nr:glycosyltransferase [Bacillus paramycoides]MED0988004.1 glycosyltransferase [Bacillus paramycoides]